MKSGVTFVCPFCGKQAAAFEDDGVVVHQLPSCPTFDRLGPLEFLVAVNRVNAAVVQ